MAFIRSLLLVALASGLLLTSFAFNIRTDVSSQEVVQLQTPDFVQAGKRYAFTWAGGGPAQTYTVKSKRQDGWGPRRGGRGEHESDLSRSGPVPTR